MSAQPIITARLAQGFSDGITLYQGQAQTTELSTLIDVFLLGEKLPPYGTLAAQGNGGTTYTNRICITAASLPAGLTTPNTHSAANSFLQGTPSAIALTSVILKIEVYRYEIISSDFGPATVSSTEMRVGYVSVPINVVAVPTTMTPTPEPSVILTQQINAIRGVEGNFSLNAVSYSSVYWTASGLPAGFNIVNNQIQGRSRAVGTTMISVTARYQEAYNSPYLTETKEIPLIVSENYETPGFKLDGSIDLFCDLQSMALSLDLPKPEQIIFDTQTVIKPNTKQLVVKPDQTLNLTLRFTKGVTLVDPDLESLRFGIGTKIGGPLLMFGDEFTKVGTGADAYYQLRVTSNTSEFDAIQKDYYDEDAVEQITADNTPGRVESPAGICELEFITGSGATFRSDSLAVLIRRSLLAGI